jgi:protein-S-isoprenylcysteine O-methyltransferase Ste14
MTISVHKRVWGTALSFFIIVIVLPAAFWAACFGIDRGLRLSRVIGEPWSSVLAASCGLVGVFWVMWAWSYLLFVGKGLPLEVFGRALHPTRVLVTTGPYAYTRNPMVIGVLFLLLGVAFLRGSWSGFVLVPLIAFGSWLYLLVFEERGLAARFGEDYERYRACVPLLFPRFTACSPVP